MHYLAAQLTVLIHHILPTGRRIITFRHTISTQTTGAITEATNLYWKLAYPNICQVNPFLLQAKLLRLAQPLI